MLKTTGAVPKIYWKVLKIIIRTSRTIVNVVVVVALFSNFVGRFLDILENVKLFFLMISSYWFSVYVSHFEYLSKSLQIPTFLLVQSQQWKPENNVGHISKLRIKTPSQLLH